MTIAELIKQVKTKKKMTNQEIADYLGVPIATFWKWPSGKREPSQKKLVENMLKNLLEEE